MFFLFLTNYQEGDLLEIHWGQSSVFESGLVSDASDSRSRQVTQRARQ